MKFRIGPHRFLIVVMIALQSIVLGCATSFEMPDLYSSFKDYRVAISEDQGDSLRFFSRSMLQRKFESILFSREPIPIITFDRTRNLFLSGGRVDVVHAYSVSRVDKGSYYLDLRYSSDRESGLRRLGLFYVEQDGQYLINSFDYYLDSVGDVPTETVDDYSHLVVPGVGE